MKIKTIIFSTVGIALLTNNVFAADYTCKGFLEGRTANPNLTQSFYSDSKTGDITSVTLNEQGTTFHHVIPVSAFIGIVNQIMQQNQNKDAPLIANALINQISSGKFKGSYSLEATKTKAVNFLQYFTTAGVNGNHLKINTLSDKLCTEAPFVINHDDLVNGYEAVTDYIGYNPANGFNGPKEVDREWDPKEGFDSWGQYFMGKDQFKQLETIFKSPDAKALAMLMNSNKQVTLMTAGTNSNWIMNTRTKKYRPRALPTSFSNILPWK